jgi:hypothetical protein
VNTKAVHKKPAKAYRVVGNIPWNNGVHGSEELRLAPVGQAVNVDRARIKPLFFVVAIAMLQNVKEDEGVEGGGVGRVGGGRRQQAPAIVHGANNSDAW